MPAAVNKDTITRGLRYSVATGNWGQQGTAGMRAGVSQVGSMYDGPMLSHAIPCLGYDNSAPNFITCESVSKTVLEKGRLERVLCQQAN